MHIAEIIRLSIMSEWLQWRNKEKGHTTPEGEEGETPSAGTAEGRSGSTGVGNPVPVEGKGNTGE